MNIGIIVYSRTGVTLSVATKLKEKLSAAGHVVNLEQIQASGDTASPRANFRFETLPDPAKYDTLVFGSWVMGGTLNPVMKAYLTQVTSLQNKRVAILVSEGFPFAWMGGNRVAGQMKRICESKGATVIGSGVVNRLNPRFKQQIVEVADRLSKLF
jgi:flavodoxin